MNKNIKIIGGLSRKAKINILIAIFFLFIIIAVFTSINQIRDIVEKREKLIELEEKLNWSRNENIELLAQEKSLYQDETIEIEAREQFNMISGDETIMTVSIEEDSEPVNDSPDKEYTDSDLWENIKIFYNKEISKDWVDPRKQQKLPWNWQQSI